jgi:maltose O-acetyltransferase
MVTDHFADGPRTNLERMLAGDLHVADDPEIAPTLTSGDDVWLGGVILCPGATVGDSTVVGAGSVVVRDLPANVLAAGRPARVVREMSDDDA